MAILPMEKEKIWTDISSDIDTTNVATVYHAYEKDGLVVFSVRLDGVTVTANGNSSYPLFKTTRPAGPVSVSLCAYSDGVPHIDANVKIDGGLLVKATSAVSNQKYVVSGCFKRS